MTLRSIRSSRAFTLIELLIVITIIGILAVALLPRITSGPSKARDAQRKADLQQIATALALYSDDHSGKYPWSAESSTYTSTAKCVSDIKNALTSYMTSVPEDPKSSSGAAVCSGGYAYLATYDGFGLSAALENSSTSGTGIYLFSAVTTTNIATSSSTTTTNYAVNTKMAASLCSAQTGGTCSSSLPAAYVLFR